MSISLRKARLDDVDALTELWIEFIDFHQDFDSFFSRAKKGHERFADFVRENIDNSEWLVLLAVENDKPIGYCMSAVMTYPPVFDMKLYGFIQDLAVTESHRRRGAGSRLVEETLRWFRKQGVKRVEVQVATTNPLSQAFWRRHDFVDYITRLARQI
jgi:ribosomal protein S18 acetylase RimI-like enzyme